MWRKIRIIIIVGIIAYIVIANFDLFFKLYEYIAMISFIPLVILVFKLTDRNK